MLAKAKGDREVEVVLMMLDDLKVKEAYGFWHKFHFLIDWLSIDAAQSGAGHIWLVRIIRKLAEFLCEDSMKFMWKKERHLGRSKRSFL